LSPLASANSIALAGIAAEAEGLQVAEVVCAAVVFGDDAHPDFDRAADRRAVAAAVGKHRFAALLAEGIEALAAELLQLVALAVAQLLAAHQGVGALLAAGDAVEGEPCPPCASRIRRATSCAGAGGGQVGTVG